MLAVVDPLSLKTSSVRTEVIDSSQLFSSLNIENRAVGGKEKFEALKEEKLKSLDVRSEGIKSELQKVRSG
jgi:hypothetical protein